MADKLTEGPVLTKITRFAVPILFGQILQQLYNIVDSIIVGRFVGVGGLAAVGATWSLTYIVCFFCIGTCNGIGIPIAQEYGADNLSGMRRFFMNGIYFSIALAVIVTALTSVLSRNFLIWLQTPENILADAHAYLLIIFLGIPFTVLYNFCFGVLMALGNSSKSSLFMAISTILNLILDWLTVVVFQMGVVGAALATIISQAAAGLCSLFFILKKYKFLYPQSSERACDMKYIKRIITMSVPMGLQYSVTAVGAIVLQYSVNKLGDTAIAAFSAGSKVKSLLLCPLNALGTALSTYVGQNFGARKMERIKKGIRDVVFLGIGYSFVIIGLMWLTGDRVAGIFVSADKVQVIEYVRKFILYISVFQIELAILFTARYSVQGMGYGKYSIASGIAEMLGRVVSALVLVPIWGFEAVCWSEGLTFFAGIVVIVPVCLVLLRRHDNSSDLYKQ